MARPVWTAGRLPYLLALIAGLAAGLGQVPFSLEVLGVLGFAGAFVLIAQAGTPGQAFRRGWVFGVAYFALTLHWIVEPFLVDAARHGWMAPFALIFLAGGLALFWGTGAAAARWAAASTPRLALAWPVAMAGVEMVRGYLLTGFPWALPSYLWIDTPAAFLGRLAGPYALTFLTFLLAAFAGWSLMRGVPRAMVAVPLAGALAMIGGGTLLRPDVPAPGPDAPVVRIVQPNIPQADKFKRDLIPVFFERKLELTAAPAERAPDIVLWPESAVPWWLERAAPAFEQMAAVSGDAKIVLGIQRGDGQRAYNSLAVLDPAGAVEHVYDKHHLVPFGEFIPLGDFMSRFGITGLAARTGNGYSAGPGPELIDLGQAGTVLPLICYEAIFPHNITSAPGRPDWMMQLTNDSWFGEIAGPYQHLAKARARSIEMGLPLLRSATTGVSAAFDPAGALLASIPLGEAGFVDVPLPPPGAPTLYSRMGDFPVSAVLFLAFIALAATRRLGIDPQGPGA